MISALFDVFPTFVINHAIWSLLLFGAFTAVYKKYLSEPNEMLENFYKFFLWFSVPFFGLMTLIIGVGSIYNHEILMMLGYVIPHIFAFVCLGYLWNVVATINFPDYTKYFWTFIVFGAIIGIFGLWEQPSVFLENGEVMLGPESLFSMIIPLGYAISAIAISASAFYAAYSTRGETRLKLSIIGIAVLLTFIVSGTLQNLGYHFIGDIFNGIWTLMYLGIAYWSELKGLLR